MRTTITGLLVLATACTQAANADPGEPGDPRAPRQNILSTARDLQGHAIAERDQGGWTLRVARAEAARNEELVATTSRPRADTDDLGRVGGESGGVAPGAAPVTKAETVEPEHTEELVDVAYLAMDKPAAAAKSPARGSTTKMHEMKASRAEVIQTLRAGSTDDNVTFDEFLGFLVSARANDGMEDRYVDMDVSGRCFLRVVDVEGLPVPGMRVRIVDEAGDRIVWRGTTYGDGRVPFYPAVANNGAPAANLFLVEVQTDAGIVRHMWNGSNDTTVRLPGTRAEEPLALDVAFVIDTTGSMGDEIAAIKATLLQVTKRLRNLDREFDLRYGAVLYRDVGDEYVTAQHDFTTDIEAFDSLLRGVEANGGGDGPESLNQGLAVAVDGLTWRDGAAKVAFLIADAPPHLDYDNDIPYDRSLAAAVARGVRVHTVAASGLDQAGSVVFRQIAQFTRGEFVFIEYGGDLGGSAAKHGVKKATGNNLDDILYTRIRDEIAHWGREYRTR